MTRTCRRAWLAEEVEEDARGPIATGLLSGTIEERAGVVAHIGPTEPGAAVAWAREHAPMVRVRICTASESDDDSFSAGERPWPGATGEPLRPWEEAPPLRRRRMPGFEHLDRTDADPCIEWDAVVSVALAGAAVPDALPSLWRDELRREPACRVVAFTLPPGARQPAPEPVHDAGAMAGWAAGPVVAGQAALRVCARTLDEAWEAACTCADAAFERAAGLLDVPVERMPRFEDDMRPAWPVGMRPPSDVA